MRREELDHIIGAAANVVGEDEFVVIGSQAILGTYADPPTELLQSMEADLYPAEHPERAIEIDGAMGDGSRFHEQFGYYAHGVGLETAKAPYGWEQRLVRLEVPPRVASSRHPVGLCLEVTDLVLAKCVAGRDRDWAYARTAIGAGLVTPDELLTRVALLPVDRLSQQHIRAVLASIGSMR